MKRILIIEDDESILRGIVENLRREHYEVSSETDGSRGFELAKREKFDLMLPSMDGLDICKKLRMEGIQVPILMLTARGEEIDKVIGLECRLMPINMWTTSTQVPDVSGC